VSEVGTKADAQKLRPTLLPPDAIIEVIKVLEFGARKYAVDNWQHVPDAYQRYEDAGFRHRLARLRGEELDPESGLHHLAHEACCILFQLWFKVRERG